jgi:hypothetical protein
MSELPNNLLNAEERRNAKRYPVRAYAALQMSTISWHAHLLDISSTGARFAILEEHLLRRGDELFLTIELEDPVTNDAKSALQLRGKIVHIREHIIGFSIQSNNNLESKRLQDWLDYFESQEKQ